MGDLLYALIIKPLELIFELIFAASYDVLPNPAVNLVIMSLAINLLVLPLYRRADIIQAEAKAKENEIRPMVEHIKKSFRGDEKVMMLQTYYDQKSYHPLSSLKSIISLLLQIPFFIAAYQFLSHLTLLNGQSMGPIKDLSQPDGLIVIGSITINLLPILMTVINIVSSEIYTKGQLFKDKIVLYLSAAIFLVLLYDSPSGLVFYWTFNNVFSLVKNLFYKIPFKEKEKKSEPVSRREILVYVFGALYMAVLTGLYIPSTVLSASPLDFLDSESLSNPANLVLYSSLIAFGFFALWMSVYYALFSSRTKKIFTSILLIMVLLSTIDYFLFGTDLGTLSAELNYDNGLVFGTLQIILSVVALVVVSALCFALRKYIVKFAGMILGAGFAVLAIIGLMNVFIINSYYDDACRMIEGQKDKQPVLELSKNEKNIVVIMIDRAIGRLVPYIFAEKPELQEQFAGFTYYPNTLSHGVSTNFGAPTIFGGYEYTPEKMNQRSDELLKDKHNESLLVMPVLFKNAGFYTTVIDPPYANYSFFPDLSLYEQYDDIHAYQLKGNTEANYTITNLSDIVRQRRFFMFSLMKTSPVFIQKLIYNGGKYYELESNQYVESDHDFIAPENVISTSQMKGAWPSFMRSYTALNALSSVTEISDMPNGCFVVMDNETSHDPVILREPDYTPSNIVDNTEYDKANTWRQTLNGVTIHLDTTLQMGHYHNNVATYIALGKWFDYLRANGVWDNTRIILVSDHGRALGHFDDLILGDYDIEALSAVLMVKDFGSGEFKTSDEFMTIADVPTLAMDGVIENPINPFTGNPITNASKFEGPQRVVFVHKWAMELNQGNVFNPGAWYDVNDNIFDRNNWKYLGDY